MEDLRDHIFSELERLGNEEKPPTKADLDRAKAICELSGKLIDSARVEVEFHKVRTSVAGLDRKPRSDFLEGSSKALPAPAAK
jgi:hypothetical protein